MTKKNGEPRAAKKSLSDRLEFIDAQIADSKLWLTELEQRRATLIQRERDKAAAILEAVEQSSGAKERSE